MIPDTKIATIQMCIRDRSLDHLNDPADQTIKQLADNLNDTGLIQASMNYHFGLQDQKNILIMMDSQDSIDLQPIIEKKMCIRDSTKTVGGI